MGELAKKNHLLELARQVKEKIDYVLGVAQPKRVYVNITKDDSGARVVDKAFAELYEAYNAGAELYCFIDAVYLGTDVQLRQSVDIVCEGYISFTCVSNDYTFVTIIHSDDTVEHRSMQMMTVAGNLDANHPVGSLFASEEPASPAELFGGTWEQVKDKFLLAAGDSYAAGETGGEAAHTLTVNEMPKHTHSLGVSETTAEGAYTYPTWSAVGVDSTETDGTKQYYSASTLTTGGGEAHNNMPPYLVVYVWRRVA